MIDCVGQNEHDHLEETWRWAYVRGKELTAMRFYKSCQVAAHLLYKCRFVKFSVRNNLSVLLNKLKRERLNPRVFGGM